MEDEEEGLEMVAFDPDMLEEALDLGQQQQQQHAHDGVLYDADDDSIGHMVNVHATVWDWCIVFDNFEDVQPPQVPKARCFGLYTPKAKVVNEEKQRRDRENKIRSKAVLLSELLRVGLTLNDDEMSVDQRRRYVLISADEDTLKLTAERMGMPMRLKAEFGGGYAPFARDRFELFEPFNVYRPVPKLFNSLQRQRIIQFLIEADKEDGGAGIDLLYERYSGNIEGAFGLHERETRLWLIKYWAKNWFQPQVTSVYDVCDAEEDDKLLAPYAMERPNRWEEPKTKWAKLAKARQSNYRVIDVVRDYFGEEIGVYFSFLGFYTQWLLYASVMGLVALVVALAGFDQGLDSWPSAFYALFLALWATWFLEFWKRKNAALNSRWNMIQFEAEERARPSFVGPKRPGVWFDGEFVELEPLDLEGVRQEVPKSQYYPPNVRKAKIAAAMMPIVLMIGVVIIATVALLTLRLALQQSSAFGDTVGGAIGSILNAIVILIMNRIYKNIAVRLNQWENHRTFTSYQDALVIKVFLFQFVNSYTSFYYIAFFKRGFNIGFLTKGLKLWGSASLQDECKASSVGVTYGCIGEVTNNLLMVLLVNLLVNQALEFFFPVLWYLLSKVLSFMGAKKMGISAEEVAQKKSQWEKEGTYSEWDGTFDEYNELIIQYGYLTLFAAALPPAPLLALANNLIEVRTDAARLLTTTQRPNYLGAQDIGLWYSILQVIGVLAVITNAALVAFGMGVWSDTRLAPINEHLFQILAVAVLLEHSVLVAKWVIQVMVPDIPGHIRQKMAKQAYLRALSMRVVSMEQKDKLFEEHFREDSDEHIGHDQQVIDEAREHDSEAHEEDGDEAHEDDGDAQVVSDHDEHDSHEHPQDDHDSFDDEEPL